MKWIFLTGLISSSISQAKITPNPDSFCLSSREYITTVHYLRDQKEFGLSEKEIQKTADSVSTGCTNASKRFINTIKILTKLGIDARSAAQTALKFASKTDKHSETFIKIFKYSYNPDKLDLDALSAINLSLSLSADFGGDLENAVENYQDIVEYCLENKSLELPLSQCAILSKDITLKGINFQKPLAPDFKKLATFLQTDKDGPKLSVLESLKITKKVIVFGPTARENYIQAFRFATAKSGLKLSHKDALIFAQKMARRSKQKSKTGS